MWTIRKTKRPGRSLPQSGFSEPPNDAVPYFVARQLLILLRMAHLAGENMRQIYSVLSPEQKTLYEPFSNIEIKPSFDQIMQLLDLSEARGILNPDEAASIRAGKVRDIQNPIPDAERNGDGLPA